MTGLLRYGKTFRCREEEILGLRMLTVTLPTGSGWKNRLFALRGAQLMRRKGIKECVFPPGFPMKEVFRRRGTLPLDRQPLLREKAGQWVLAERQANELTGSVALAAERVTEDVARAAELLLKKVGRVELLLIPGAEVLQKRLLRETGASLRLVREEQLSRNETLLSFGYPSAGGQALTLRIGEAGESPRFLLPESLRRKLPRGTNEEDFCVLLRRSGRITSGEIGVKSRK